MNKKIILIAILILLTIFIPIKNKLNLDYNIEPKYREINPELQVKYEIMNNNLQNETIQKHSSILTKEEEIILLNELKNKQFNQLED